MERNKQKESPLTSQVCVLVYDGECRLCVFTKEKMEQVGIGQPGSDVRFLSYQNEEAKERLGTAYHPGRPDMAFMIRPSGEVLQGIEAFYPLLHHLPGGKLLSWSFRFSLIKRLAEWGYRMIARHRYRWFGEAKAVHPGQ